MNTTNEITWTVILSDLISKARFGLVITRAADFKYTLEATYTIFVHKSVTAASNIFLSSKYLTKLLLRLKKEKKQLYKWQR